MLGLSQRATIDLDVVARRKESRWRESWPLPIEPVTRTFGALTVQLLAREDLIVLKLC